MHIHAHLHGYIKKGQIYGKSVMPWEIRDQNCSKKGELRARQDAGGRARTMNLLTTSGNRIVDAATGRAVLLRGVNRSGLEYAWPDEDGFASGAGISRAEIEYIAAERSSGSRATSPPIHCRSSSVYIP